MSLRWFMVLVVIGSSFLLAGCFEPRIPPEQLGEVILDPASLPGKDTVYEPKGLPPLSPEEMMNNL